MDKCAICGENTCDCGKRPEIRDDDFIALQNSLLEPYPDPRWIRYVMDKNDY